MFRFGESDAFPAESGKLPRSGCMQPEAVEGSVMPVPGEGRKYKRLEGVHHSPPALYVRDELPCPPARL